jgi:hypothetical protein
LVEKQIRCNKETFITFVDLKKAFENVQWKKLFEILKRVGIKYDRKLSMIEDSFIICIKVKQIDGGKKSKNKKRRQGCM